MFTYPFRKTEWLAFHLPVAHSSLMVELPRRTLGSLESPVRRKAKLWRCQLKLEDREK